MIVVVDTGYGNLASVLNMGRKAGGALQVSRDPAVVAGADKLILPGVGNFGRAIAGLDERGLRPALHTAVRERGVPILGLCLGLQLFTRGSEEGDAQGLGWLNADTVRFAGSPELKVPHMGWNQVEIARPDPLVSTLPAGPRFYFVHSYYVRCDDPGDVVLWATYGVRFAAGVRRDNIWGMQFHPEKSHAFGLALLRQFVALS